MRTKVEEHEEETMTFLEHLEEFRKMVLRCAAATFLGMVIAVPFLRQILAVILQPLRDIGVDPDTFLFEPNVMGGLRVAVSVAFWSGLLMATPFNVFFIARFVFPGLHRHEKKLILRFSWVAVLLFFVGVTLGYFGTVSHAVYAMAFAIHNYMGTSAEMWYLTGYISMVIRLVLGFGLAFELPLVLLLLGYAGLVDVSSLRHYRRHVVVGLLVMAMVLTPPEPVSQLIMATCLYLMYEVCIVLLWVHEKRSGREVRG